VEDDHVEERSDSELITPSGWPVSQA